MPVKSYESPCEVVILGSVIVTAGGASDGHSVVHSESSKMYKTLMCLYYKASGNAYGYILALESSCVSAA